MQWSSTYLACKAVLEYIYESVAAQKISHGLTRDMGYFGSVQVKYFFDSSVKGGLPAAARWLAEKA